MMRLLGSVPLGALLAMSCRAPAPPAPRERPPEGEVWLTDAQLKAAQMQIEPSKMVPVAETVSLAGRIAFDDMRVTHVFSPVTGKVGKILAYPGANVKQGAPLAEIDSPDVGNAMSDLLKAQADAETATYELERQKELYEQHATPKKDYEIAANAASRARAELERTRQKMRLLRVDGKGPVTQTFVLRAPLSGEVVTRAVSPGMEVQGQYTGGAVA